MFSRAFTIVVDIGKTLSKVTLWTVEGEMLDRQVHANRECVVGGARRLDSVAIERWLVEALGRYRGTAVQNIIPVAHGAGLAAIRNGVLAFAPLDYEQPIPAHALAAYRAERDSFAETGSPALPDGLNLGAQLAWLEEKDTDSLADTTLVPWAQYWAWFLSGKAVSEVTSLGCHSDLWNPTAGRYSSFAVRRGWAARFAPLVRAADVIGTLRPELARSTGLGDDVKIFAGLHDSNAALLAARGFTEIADREATILSTGTWFVAMRLAIAPMSPAALPENRDCLVNVDAFGRAIPSARFMGGREIESVIGIDTRRVDIKPDQPALMAAVPDILRRNAMLLPTLAPGSGPFPDAPGAWINEPEDWYARRAAVCLYAALVADVSLDQIGACGRLLVEGRFAEAEVFVRALAALRPETRVFTANAHNDVSFGALRLIDPDLRPEGQLKEIDPLNGDLAAYRETWRAHFGAGA